MIPGERRIEERGRAEVNESQRTMLDERRAPEEAQARGKKREEKKSLLQLTSDKTPPRPIHLTSHQHPRTVPSRPHQTRPRLDRERPSTRYVRSPRRRHHRHKLVEIYMNRFVLKLALGLLGSESSWKRFDVGHFPSEVVSGGGGRCPVGGLDVC